LCFLKFSIFVVLAFLECLLYILVQYHLYKILIDYMQNSSFWLFFGIVYLLFLESGSGYLFSSLLHFPLVPELIYYWWKWFPSFFCLPFIALATVTVPVLCVIQYCLACNSNSDDI
jgi:hypothetical protein